MHQWRIQGFVWACRFHEGKNLLITKDLDVRDTRDKSSEDNSIFKLKEFLPHAEMFPELSPKIRKCQSQ